MKKLNKCIAIGALVGTIAGPGIGLTVINEKDNNRLEKILGVTLAVSGATAGITAVGNVALENEEKKCNGEK